jgi:2-keto-4-pentenoate hydratase/2-oxohepta-3-ene-1,7-dioic acid hydratase in catechol pathway
VKLANFVKNGAAQAGIVTEGLIFDIQGSSNKLGLSRFKEPLIVDSILSGGLLAPLIQSREKLISAGTGRQILSVRLLSPIISPEKILLVAINYVSHGREQGRSPPQAPYFFTKFRNTLIGPDEPVLLPSISKQVDWEVELAVIIGKLGKNISRKNAMDYVAGYAVANDVSFRDFQNSTRGPDGKTTLGLDWVKGKGLDSSFPLGPYLVTKDEIADPYNLEISLSVSGQTRQRSNTREMVFKIDSLIEYVSAGMTLKPGDILSTGTPEGVAVHTGQPFLKDRDVLEGTIDGIGILRNPVKAE